MNGLAAPTLPRTASGGLTAARDADCGASHSAAPSGRAGTCVHCGHVATRTVAGCDKLGGARGYRKRRRMLRPAQPRPPFPACFQVTHRKIFLFSAVFRLTVANVSGVCVRNQHAPPRILDEDSPPQPQAAISDDARRHTCPCKPFYWVIHGVPPRIRYTFYSDSCLQAVEKPFSGSRAPRHAVNGSTGAFRECTQCEHVPRGQRAPCAGMAACELGWLAHGSRPACATTRRGIRNGEHEGATAAPPETPPTFPCLLSGDTLKNISFSVVFHDG